MSQHTIVFLSYYQHHHRLFRVMAQALPGDITVKHFGIYPLTLRRLLVPPSGANHPTDETIDEIIRFYYAKKVDKFPKHIRSHWHRLLKRNAAQWYRLFSHKLSGADLLVVWNGFAIPLNAAVTAAKAQNISVAFCENGVLPGTIAIDPKGINYAGSLTGLPVEFYRQFELEPEKVHELQQMALQQRPLRKANGDVTADCDDGKPLPARYVLFAMQVHDDSQVLLFSPRFHSMHEVVSYVHEQLCRYNAQTGDDLRLVVKEHPSDYGRVDYRALRSSLPDVFFLRTTPISAIIGNAQTVVTINSSVGIEGLIYQRPVITLGDAFYNVPGIVHHLEANEDLSAILPDVISSPPDRELVIRFLYFLRYQYLIPGSLRNRNTSAMQLAAQRLLDILDGNLSWS